MSVLYLDWGGDFQLTQNGSLLMASGWDEARQLTVRAILTNPATTLPSGRKTPPDYIFDGSYGGGLGLYVGQDMTNKQLNQLERVISQQVLSQTFVDPAYAPQVDFQTYGVHGMLITINMNLVSNQTGTISLQVS